MIPIIKPNDILNSLNQYRSSKGLKPVIMNSIVNKESQRHSDNMALGKVPFSHDGLNERFANIKKEGLNFINGSENVAMGSSNKNPVEMWKTSEGHNRNMLGNYDTVGIGCSMNSKKINYYCLIVLRTK